MTAAAHGSTNAQGAVIATSPASMPLHIIVVSGLSPFTMSVTIAAERTDDAGEHRVHDNEADAQIGARECRTRIKSEPAESQDERSQHDHRHVVTRHGIAVYLCIEFANARPDDHRSRQRDNAAHRVNNTRTGEIDRSMTKTPIQATLRQPTTTPDPIAIEAIRQRNPQTEQAEILPGPAFGHRTGGNRCGGIHKNHHEKEQHQNCGIADGTGQKPALQTDKAISKRARSFTSSIDCCTQAPTSLSSRQAWDRETGNQPGATGPFHQLPQPIANP